LEFSVGLSSLTAQTVMVCLWTGKSRATKYLPFRTSTLQLILAILAAAIVSMPVQASDALIDTGWEPP